MTNPETPPYLDEREQAVATAQPVRLISIDDITIGELMSLQFKLFIASLPSAVLALLIWAYAHYIIRK